MTEQEKRALWDWVGETEHRASKNRKDVPVYAAMLAKAAAVVRLEMASADLAALRQSDPK
jgi:hypothetical protein